MLNDAETIERDKSSVKLMIEAANAAKKSGNAAQLQTAYLMFAHASYIRTEARGPQLVTAVEEVVQAFSSANPTKAVNIYLHYMDGNSDMMADCGMYPFEYITQALSLLDDSEASSDLIYNVLCHPTMLPEVQGTLTEDKYKQDKQPIIAKNLAATMARLYNDDRYREHAVIMISTMVAALSKHGARESELQAFSTILSNGPTRNIDRLHRAAKPAGHVKEN